MARSKDEHDQELTGTDAVTALMSQMLLIQQQQAQALQEQSDRTRPKDDPNYVAKSIFLKPTAGGEPWASDLKCQMYLGPIHLNKTPLTKAEVDALNTMQRVEKATITKMDGSTQLLTVRGREDAVGRLERLTIEISMKKDDNPQFLPGMVSICQQLAAQYPVLTAA